MDIIKKIIFAYLLIITAQPAKSQDAAWAAGVRIIPYMYTGYSEWNLLSAGAGLQINRKIWKGIFMESGIQYFRLCQQDEYQHISNETGQPYIEPRNIRAIHNSVIVPLRAGLAVKRFYLNLGFQVQRTLMHKFEIKDLNYQTDIETAKKWVREFTTSIGYNFLKSEKLTACSGFFISFPSSKLNDYALTRFNTYAGIGLEICLRYNLNKIVKNK